MTENTIAKKLVELEIQNRKDALELYDKIIPVVKKFDGKILNKRFDTALKEIDNYLSYDRRFSFFSIEWYTKNDFVKGEPDRLGMCMAHYVKTRQLTLTSHLYAVADRTFPDKVMADENGRMKADVIIKALEEGKAKLETEICAMEIGMEKADEYKKKLEELKAEIEKTTKEIPYLIKDYFDLDYSVRKSY